MGTLLGALTSPEKRTSTVTSVLQELGRQPQPKSATVSALGVLVTLGKNLIPVLTSPTLITAKKRIVLAG